jgi:hypothetical protein
MYTLIMIIGIVSGSGSPVGVTSQTVGKFGNLEACKRAAEEPITGGTISELNLSRGIYWYCVYSGS